MVQVKESILIFILSIVAVTNLYDFMQDLSHGASNWHLVEEMFVILISITAIAWLAINLIEQQHQLKQLKQEIATSKSTPVQEPDQKILKARQQLSEVIQAQFLDWKLTTGEQEVALLLLKGLSFKEISAVRNTLEKTVRQQASGIYRKAGVNGRHAFSAWFIEDFL